MNEVSSGICATSKYLVSSLNNELYQVRSLCDTELGFIENASSSEKKQRIPFAEIKFGMEYNDTILSMLPINTSSGEKVLTNTAADKSFLFDPENMSLEQVVNNTGSKFPCTFQRRDKYHFIPDGKDNFIVYTECLKKDEPIPNRVYNLKTRGPPIISELEELSLRNREILSMEVDDSNNLGLLINSERRTYLKKIDPVSRNEVYSKPLRKKYKKGDRLHKMGLDTLIVRHLRKEIVDVDSEETIKLFGVENNVAIPEISSTWDYPQYLYVNRMS